MVLSFTASLFGLSIQQVWQQTGRRVANEIELGFPKKVDNHN